MRAGLGVIIEMAEGLRLLAPGNIGAGDCVAAVDVNPTMVALAIELEAVPFEAKVGTGVGWTVEVEAKSCTVCEYVQLVKEGGKSRFPR